MKDLNIKLGRVNFHIQIVRPFLVRKWCFTKRQDGLNVHLFPLHIHFDYKKARQSTTTYSNPAFSKESLDAAVKTTISNIRYENGCWKYNIKLSKK